MISRDSAALACLVSAVAATRLAFRSHYLYDLDSVNFALGMEHFDPRVHQPQPPGYFLYICLGRALNSLLHDANLALVLLSVAASCGAVWMIYKLALTWFGSRAALFASLLFLFSPLAWFYGTVALTYSVEAFLSALLGYLCWQISGGSSKLSLPTGIVLGLSGGVRPSSLLFLGPLFLFSLRNAKPREWIAGMAALAFTFAAWFFPMIHLSGGFNAYFASLLSLWRLVPAKDTVFNSSPATSIARACTIVFIYFLGFGAASLAPLAALRVAGPIDTQKKIFTLVWIIPALCFFTFIFLKFVNSGYLLLLSAPACIWLGLWISHWSNGKLRRVFGLTLITAGAATNVAIFLISPFYCSYRSIRRFEAELSGIETALPRVVSQKDTLIVGFDSHFLGYRHAGYYLPSYLTVEYPEVRLGEATRIFAMQNHETHLLSALPQNTYSKFVFFPLPPGNAEYKQYLDEVIAQLHRENLRRVDVAGYHFVTGSSSSLPLIFPPPAAGTK